MRFVVVADDFPCALSTGFTLLTLLNNFALAIGIGVGGRWAFKYNQCESIHE